MMLLAGTPEGSQRAVLATRALSLCSLLVSLGLALAGCRGTTAAAEAGLAQEPAPTLSSSSAALDDGQIVEILDAMDTQQILTAQLGADRAATAETRAFASDLVGSRNADRIELLRRSHREKTALQPSLLVDLIERPGRQARAKLSNERGLRFDHDFLASEIDARTRELDWLDHMLIPAAQSDDLRVELTQRRITAAARLEESRQLDLRLSPAPP